MFQIKHLDLPACNHGEGLIWVEESKKLVWVDVFEKPEVKIFNFELDQYKSIPVTLISGKFIHNPNINLPSLGYGLPILPLEQFNILKVDKIINYL